MIEKVTEFAVIAQSTPSMMLVRTDTPVVSCAIVWRSLCGCGGAATVRLSPQPHAASGSKVVIRRR